jgi:hypothetical protein
MAWTAILLAALQAVAAIPAIGKYVEQGCSAIVLWWVSRQNEANQGAILDALAAGMKAETKEQRLDVAKKWQNAISRAKPL